MTKLSIALAHVETLLNNHVIDSAKPKKVKATVGKKPEGKVVMATEEEWNEAIKIVAMHTPNLRMLKRKVQRGLLTVEEVVGATQEALRKKHVSMRLTDAIGEVLRDALMEGEIIDVEGQEPASEAPPA